jgi:multiple sugar transport system substrate-binding protein
MKKFLWFFSMAAVLLLILGGCSRNNGVNNGNTTAASGVSSDLFTGKIEGEITVYAYDSLANKSFLEGAARAFEALYPGTKVNVETFSSMPEVRTGGQGNMSLSMIQNQDNPQARADYLSRVNTNLMSGTGADLYAIDVLPLYKFTENGVLENLDPYMERDPAFNKADYRKNILDAIRYRNGTWFIPLDYSFNYFAYDSTLVPQDIAAGFGPTKAFSTNDLFKIGIPLYTDNYKLFNTQDFSRGLGMGMFSQLLSQSIGNFVNLETKKPNFLDGGFTGLLNTVRDYAEKGFIPRGVAGQNAEMVMQQTRTEPTDRFFFKLQSCLNLMSVFTRSLGMVMRMEAGGVRAIDTDDQIAGIQSNADGSVPFTYSRSFGINSQSKNKAAAWAFLKFLLSKETQISSNSGDIPSRGFLLHNGAREETGELTFAGLFRNQNGVLNDQQRRALEEYKTTLETLSDRINTFTVQETSLNDMIAQEVQYFFGGSRNADEVARVLQNKTELYLSE